MPPLTDCPESGQQCKNYRFWDPSPHADGCFHGCARGEKLPPPPPRKPRDPLKEPVSGTSFFGLFILPLTALFSELRWREVARKTDDPPLKI